MTLIDATSVHRRTLPNGLRVIARRDASAPVVAIVTYVSAGYFDETDDVVGIAHVLEHMYFKGTARRGVGEIARETKAVGGYLNAATIYDHTVYYTVAPASGFETALDVQSDAYRNSAIDATELAKELEVIIQEAKRKVDNPGAVTIETLYELLHDRHRIRRWRIGHEPGLRRLTRSDVVGFYRNFYRPANTVLSIVGDVELERAFSLVEQRYGDIEPGEPARTPGDHEGGSSGFRFRDLTGDVTQSQFALGWRVPGTLHPDAPGLDMLAIVLGAGRASRLYRAVRERKLASSIGAFNYTPRDIGVFAIHGETPPERTGDAMAAVWDQLRRVRTEGIGSLELERARRINESRWIRRLEDMEGQATHLAEWEALGNWELGERYYERMQVYDAEAMRQLARRYLDDENVAVLAYRPRGSNEIARDATAMRARLTHAAIAPLDANPEVKQPAAVVDGDRPARAGVDSGVHIYRLASGVPVLVKRRPGAPLVYTGVFAVGGLIDEREELGGRTLLMARTALKGTARRTAVHVAEDGELLGGSVGAAVGAESLGWTISVPARHAPAAVELLSDVAQHPVFDAAALETERVVALAELASLRDDMYRYPMRLAARTAFPDHPYGLSLLGSEESLRSLDRDALAAWHAERILGAPLVLAIVGDGDPDDLAMLLARHFRELRYQESTVPARPTWPASQTTAAERRDKAQTAMAFLWPAPTRDDPARFDMAMLSGIASGLGGRFFEELRDKQSLCYTVQAYASERRAAGTFMTYIATSPEKEEVARAGLLRELARFRDEPVGAEELRRAQTYAIGVHQIRQQSGAAVLGELVDAWMFGRLADLADHEGAIRAVTAERILDTARTYFDGVQHVEGIVRGEGKTV